jgi:hypothetical protein
MNHSERRELMKRAKNRLNKAKTWILVTFDGKGVPIYSYDVSALKDEHDLRHQAMHALATHAEKMCTEIFKFMDKMNVEATEMERVKEFKNKRSEELIVAGRTFQQEPVKDNVS